MPPDHHGLPTPRSTLRDRAAAVAHHGGRHQGGNPLRYVFLVMICMGVAGPALSAGSTFDGVYTGTRVLTKGSRQACPAEGAVSVTIRGDTLTSTRSQLRGSVISFRPRPDGRFRQISTGIRGSTILIEGRIVGDILDADVTIRTCTHHWHLTKNPP